MRCYSYGIIKHIFSKNLLGLPLKLSNFSMVKVIRFHSRNLYIHKLHYIRLSHIVIKCDLLEACKEYIII